MSESDLPTLRLKPREDHRLRAGHSWVFSNEVDSAETPLRGFESGQPVAIAASTGKIIGTGYVNPQSLIAARLVSRDHQHPFSASLLVHRLKVALALRDRLFDGPYYRLAYGESDGLPGLVVDRYGALLAVQVTTAGMERMKDEIVDALHKVVAPEVIVFRNDSAVRELEGLDRYVEAAYGRAPDTATVVERGARFDVPFSAGQKTGWFFDQHTNRGRLARYVRDRTVLDVYSYVGAWGVQAALHGAARVSCIEASALALEHLSRNAELNGVSDRVEPTHGDAFAELESLREQGTKFDVVVVDPPAFIKRRKDVRAGQQGYRRLNQLAMQLLSREGILISCSCSSYLHNERFTELLLRSARHLERSLQILEFGGQGPDHPVHPAIPETAYLKAWFTRVLPV